MFKTRRRRKNMFICNFKRITKKFNWERVIIKKKRKKDNSNPKQFQTCDGLVNTEHFSPINQTTGKNVCHQVATCEYASHVNIYGHLKKSSQSRAKGYI